MMWRPTRLLASVCCLVLFQATTLTVSARTWTDTRGVTVEADFIKYENGLVYLQHANGRISTIPWDRLSKKDQHYVNFVSATSGRETELMKKLGIGVFFGLAPLIVANRKKHIGVGLIFFIACVIGGGLVGTAAALPICVVSMVIVGMLPD